MNIAGRRQAERNEYKYCVKKMCTAGMVRKFWQQQKQNQQQQNVIIKKGIRRKRKKNENICWVGVLGRFYHNIL